MGYDALGPGLAGAAKEMVMSYPVNAFVRCSCDKAPDGALLFVRDYWTMAARVNLGNQSDPKTLVLTGDDAGSVYGRFIDEGLCTAPGVVAEFRIPRPEEIVTDGSRLARAGLAITENGSAVIWGHTLGAEGFRAGFGPDGQSVPQADSRPYFYRHYEVWLTRDGKDLSDAPLFVVGA